VAGLALGKIDTGHVSRCRMLGVVFPTSQEHPAFPYVKMKI
jgi:hypothetical protein